jgi:hypothetical protein
MSAEFFDFEFQPRTSNQGGDFGAQSYGRLLRLMRRIPQNVAHLFLHAAAIAPRTPLQAGFDAIFKVPDHKLGHGHLLLELMIS